jgi:hypothetical protein
LSNFGTTSFRRASATTTRGHTGAISDRAWSTTKLVLSAESAGFIRDVTGSRAAPSVLSSAGSAFSIAYRTSAVSARRRAGRAFPGGRLPGAG